MVFCAYVEELIRNNSELLYLILKEQIYERYIISFVIIWTI